MADYDSAELTDREKQAAEHQTETSKQLVRDIQNQLAKQMRNYDFADQQNRNLANVQLQQNSRKDSADRFEAQRDLQSAALGLFGSMGTAMNGSTLGNMMHMLRQRNDKENNTYWAQHQANQDAVENAYQDSRNQNLLARRDAMQSAEKAIRDVEGDWRANLNNINPTLFPGGIGAVAGERSLASQTAWDDMPKVPMGRPTISGYVNPDYNMRSEQSANRRASNATSSSDYFSQMMNRFNGR